MIHLKQFLTWAPITQEIDHFCILLDLLLKLCCRIHMGHIHNNYKHHSCRVCCTSEVLSIMFKRAFCDTGEIEKFYPHPLTVYLVTGALATAKAVLTPFRYSFLFFWWYSYHSATVAAVVSVIPGSQQPQSWLCHHEEEKVLLGLFLNSFS